MKIIVPMAGAGKRMRPHTLTTPKPLIPIAGKSIVERLVNQIAGMVPDPIDEVAYVTGRFGTETEAKLETIAHNIGAEASIHYQDEALGTAHAIYCADASLEGNVVIAFADTLFDADFTIDPKQDGVIWVKHVENPSQFGVVETDKEGVIGKFVEKPANPVSNEAIIGIYYFKDGAWLHRELQDLIDKGITGNGEYQLTDAIENMREQGAKLKTAPVNHWMDCGNKDATVDTNSQILELGTDIDNNPKHHYEQENAVVIEPCYIGDQALIRNSVVGPYVSIGAGSTVENSVLDRSLIMEGTHVINGRLSKAMIGNQASFKGHVDDINLGDYSAVK